MAKTMRRIALQLDRILTILIVSMFLRAENLLIINLFNKFSAVINHKRRFAMEKKEITFDEYYDLDNVYNCDSDELYASKDGEASFGYN